MPLHQWLRLKAINGWYLFMAVALNVLWILIFTWFVSLITLRLGSISSVQQLLMLLVAFIGPMFIAWLISGVAADGRGPTYGVYGSFGSIIVLAFTALSAGVFGLMLMIVAFAGGLNGGLLSLRNP